MSVSNNRDALYSTSEDPEGTPFSFAAFEDANRDWPLAEDECATIRALAPGESVVVGGGACGDTTISRAS